MMTSGGGGRGKEREKPQTWSSNTCALARTTLEITIGCLCQGPSKRFPSACKLSTRKKTCSTVRLFGPCLKTGRTRPEKNAFTRAGHRKRCSKWPPLARTHAKHLRMNPVVHAFLAASGSRADTARTIIHGAQFELGRELALSHVHRRGAHHGAWVALAVLFDAHIGIEICLTRRLPVGSNHRNRTVLGGSSVMPAEELLVREHHAHEVQVRHLPFATDREHAHALQRVTAEVQSCQSRCGCQSRLTDGLQAPRLEIVMQPPATEESATCPVSCAGR